MKKSSLPDNQLTDFTECPNNGVSIAYSEKYKCYVVVDAKKIKKVPTEKELKALENKLKLDFVKRYSTPQIKLDLNKVIVFMDRPTVTNCGYRKTVVDKGHGYQLCIEKTHEWIVSLYNKSDSAGWYHHYHGRTGKIQTALNKVLTHYEKTMKSKEISLSKDLADNKKDLAAFYKFVPKYKSSNSVKNTKK